MRHDCPEQITAPGKLEKGIVSPYVCCDELSNKVPVKGRLGSPAAVQLPWLYWSQLAWGCLERGRRDPVAWAWPLLDADLVPESTFYRLVFLFLQRGNFQIGFPGSTQTCLNAQLVPLLCRFLFSFLDFVRSGVELAEHGHDCEASQC